MSPKEFLRSRRPHLFSDSELVSELELPRRVLEYHLDTITSRKQEVEFENYCRRICEREICPNLRPQTGPTGGGDSKADASSYEVDPGLAERVFWGSLSTPTPKRWCFAFSAKKGWSEKVRKDVEGIAGIVPRPDKVYFVTSRYARDKTRARIEAELLNEHGIPVEILDREWLLTKTFQNGHADLAAECFHLGDVRADTRLGPNDASREAELKPLLAKLRRPDENYSSDYVLAEEYLRAAHLARGLERPRHEVEGLLRQAERLAQSTTSQQLLRARYDLAWTSFFWFEEPASTLSAYQAMEGGLADIEDADDLELYSNILSLLRTSVAQERLGPDEVMLEAKFDAIVDAAKRLELDTSRPANALLARTQRAIVEMVRAPENDNRVSAALDELHDCLTSADRLSHYPLLDLVHFLDEMGEVLSTFSGYDRVFRALCDLRGRLLGDRERARMLLRNGYRLLKQGRHADALRELGEARRCILEKDSLLLRADISMVTALVYEASALYWAARMEFAIAAHFAITEAKGSGFASRRAAYATIHLTWVELRLGRIPCALSWYELATGIVRVLEQRGEEVTDLFEGLRGQDGLLSLFFLAADEQTLTKLTRLPDTLEQLGLYFARWSLLFALGHEDVLHNEGLENTTVDSPAELYDVIFDHPAFADIPAGDPVLHAQRTDVVSTQLVGMELQIEHDNAKAPVALAENLISAAEAWFATASWEDLFFVNARLGFRVREGKLGSGVLPDVAKLLGGEDEIRIHSDWVEEVGAGPDTVSAFGDWVLSFLAGITAQSIPSTDGGMEEVIASLAQSESFARALTYLPISKVTLDQVPRQMLEQWEAEGDYPMRRSEAWWRTSHASQRSAAIARVSPRPSHRPVVNVQDLIEVERWNKAGWHMALQMVFPDHPTQPPVLGLVFRDPNEGARIFERIGERLRAAEVRLRVAILLGPGGIGCEHYAITVGPDLEYAVGRTPVARDLDARVIAVHRGLQLTRTTDTLRMFVEDYRAKGSFLLVPAAPDQSICWDVGLECTELVVREAAEVQASDPDAPFAQKLLKDSQNASRASTKSALEKKSKRAQRKRKKDARRRRKRGKRKKK